MAELQLCWLCGAEMNEIKWHPNMKNLSGMMIGKLNVKTPSKRDSDGHIMWLCECECGKTKEIVSNSLTRKNPVKSCGCMNKTVAQSKIRNSESWNDGKSYLIKDGTHCYKTRHGWSKAAIKKFGNKCQICGWDKARCDVHHKTPKTKGGLHTLENAIVICPNCHREEHNK
jgi:predicted HNH restriction endonuclease